MTAGTRKALRAAFARIADARVVIAGRQAQPVARIIGDARRWMLVDGAFVLICGGGHRPANPAPLVDAFARGRVVIEARPDAPPVSGTVPTVNPKAPTVKPEAPAAKRTTPTASGTAPSWTRKALPAAQRTTPSGSGAARSGSGTTPTASGTAPSWTRKALPEVGTLPIMGTLPARRTTPSGSGMVPSGSGTVPSRTRKAPTVNPKAPTASGTAPAVLHVYLADHLVAIITRPHPAADFADRDRPWSLLHITGHVEKFTRLADARRAAADRWADCALRRG